MKDISFPWWVACGIIILLLVKSFTKWLTTPTGIVFLVLAGIAIVISAIFGIRYFFRLAGMRKR